MFLNRTEAGLALAERLVQYGEQDAVVLGLPRGGIPVAAEVARVLGAELDLIIVRKLGVPDQPEFAVGAIGEGGVRVLDENAVSRAGIRAADLAGVDKRERAELERRVKLYRGDNPPVELSGRTVIIVDDGLATGATAKAACQVVKARGAAWVVLAVPVAPKDWSLGFEGIADVCIALDTPRHFYSVGRHYKDFGQTSDAEVLACLAG